MFSETGTSFFWLQNWGFPSLKLPQLFYTSVKEFCYEMGFSLQKQSQKSRSILWDGIFPTKTIQKIYSHLLGFSLQKQYKNLHLFYKMDLDFSDCFKVHLD